ncbi:MAG: gliding motility protein GldN [Dysgonomonas sp.]|jgi:gliding motility associated protien GldN|nr:gliding motility protein GldN [Dysgonomonas sp.]
MKRILLITIIGICGLLTGANLHAQQEGTLRDRLARRQAQQNNQSGDKQLTVRAQIMNQAQTQDIGDVTWMREIYRFLDLEKEKNAALYYPVRPIGERQNLFSMLFSHVLNGTIDVYEYQLDGSERFSEQYKMKIDSAFFLKFDIPFTVTEEGKYHVDPADIPGEEIRGYYIKETWYFDKNNSVVDIKTEAICPVMMYQEYDASGLSRFPLFWVPYEEVRPYASRMPIMISSLNNASTHTINDFFVKHNFDGEIVKTTNMTNRTLAEQFEGDSLKKEQQKIETQLKQFNENLWVYNDSIGIADRAAVASKSKKNNKGKAIKGDTETSEASDRAQIQREAKQQKSTPVRSMRNRRRN